MTALHRLAAAFRSTACKRALTGAALALFLFGAPPQNAHAFGDDPVLHRMDMELHENARLRTEAGNARRKGGEEAKKAREALAASDERLERTRVETLAHVAGVSQEQVEQLRHDGRSWGQAAGDLGVHPGFLGVDNTPMYRQAATEKAPAKAATASARSGRKPGAVKSGGGAAVHKAHAKAAPKGKAKSALKAKPKAKIHAKAASKGKPQSTLKAKPKAKIHTKAASKGKTHAKVKAGAGRGVHKHSKAKRKR